MLCCGVFLLLSCGGVVGYGLLRYGVLRYGSLCFAVGLCGMVWGGMVCCNVILFVPWWGCVVLLFVLPL